MNDPQQLPPTARLVYVVLEKADEPLTKAEIAERAYTKKRSITKGLDYLRDADLVDAKPMLSDVRYHRYSLKREH